jgi:ribose 5-phosphate isomerase B
MIVALGADHGGFAMKEDLKKILLAMKITVLDKGACEYEASDDYPDFASAVAKSVSAGEADRGILLCGSGVGVTIAANKFKNVRACLCHDTYSAKQGVQHDAMNILCLGARIIGIELAKELVKAFLSTEFDTQERFQRRLDKVLELEK